MTTNRFIPCSLVREKKTGKLAIVQYDYTYAFGNYNNGSNFVDLSLFELDESGNVENNSAWHNSADYELVSLPTMEIFEKVNEYQRHMYGRNVRVWEEWENKENQVKAFSPISKQIAEEIRKAIGRAIVNEIEKM